MTKILLVEDDNNLREIYEARFQAEGYEIVSAHDGEEALVVAKAEKPDLIISDVMMPKISGFEMLDILRNTDTLKNVKVIMLTALGQSDDQQRADKLGADKYLVKSQVTLEDIVNVANELLNPGVQADASMPSAPSAVPAASITTDPTPNAAPAPSVTPVAAPSVVPTSTTTEPDGPATIVPPPEPSAIPENKTSDIELAEPANQEEKNVSSQIESFMNNANPAEADTVTAPQSSAESNTPPISPQKQPLLPEEDKEEDKPAEYSPQPVGKKVIEPLPSEEDQPDINDLLAKETAIETVTSPESKPAVETSVTASATPMTQAPTTQTPTDDSTHSTFDANDIAL